jgi:hypothetical protein
MFITLLIGLACGPLHCVEEPEVIGSSRQLFLDHHLLEALNGAELVLGTPRDEGAVFQFDQPWEGPFCGYSTVIQDGERFLLYYRGLPEAGADGSNRETTCVALSSDGVHWERPELGLHAVDGSRANNVILADVAPVTHNFSPFLDTRPGVNPQHRFKGLGGNEDSGLIAWTSADGLRWSRLREAPVVTGAVFDSQNVSFYSETEGLYLCYMRTWTGGGYSGLRSVSRSTSEDFLNWSTPVPMGFGEGQLEHIYTNQTHPYFRAPQIYVAIAARFMPGRQVLSLEEADRLGVNPSYFKDCSDAVLMSSRGGARFQRTFREALIRPGIGLQNWVSRSNYPALNIVQTSPEEMSLYVNQNYAQPTAELRRYSMRLDGLASVRAPASGGEVLTQPLVFTGDRLSVNFATSAAGGVRIELQDALGHPIPGFTLEEAVELIGNEIERDVSWQGGTDVSSLAGKPVRLRFVMTDADLYSYRFIEDVEVRSVERIWGEAPHSAFTDLLKVDSRLYCTFREGDDHVFGADGRIRVIMREGEGEWQSVALLEKPTADLRDPKLCLLPDGRIMLNCGGSYYQERKLLKRQSMVSFSDSDGLNFGEVQPVVIDEAVRSEDDWLWRVTWHGEVGYGVIYQPGGNEWLVQLLSTRDGIGYELITTLDVQGSPNETTLRVRENGEMVALIRREGSDQRAVFGRSLPPYEDWRFSTLPVAIGGPNLIESSAGDWWVAGRDYAGGQTRTMVAHLGKDGAWTEPVILPSSGDTSYPGLVRINRTLLVSYYSSHEGKTAIYLATLELPEEE